MPRRGGAVVILATQQPEEGGSQVGGRTRANLVRPYLKNKTAGGMAQVVERSSTRLVLSSIPNAT
jgi:hypothetical protein